MVSFTYSPNVGTNILTRTPMMNAENFPEISDTAENLRHQTQFSNVLGGTEIDCLP